jgi:hypothetical protein
MDSDAKAQLLQRLRLKNNERPAKFDIVLLRQIVELDWSGVPLRKEVTTVTLWHYYKTTINSGRFWQPSVFIFLLFMLRLRLSHRVRCYGRGFRSYRRNSGAIC